MQTSNNPTTGLILIKTFENKDTYCVDADCKHTSFYLKNELDTKRSGWSISTIKEMLPPKIFCKYYRSHIISLANKWYSFLYKINVPKHKVSPLILYFKG